LVDDVHMIVFWSALALVASGIEPFTRERSIEPYVLVVAGVLSVARRDCPVTSSSPSTTLVVYVPLNCPMSSKNSCPECVGWSGCGEPVFQMVQFITRAPIPLPGVTPV